MKPTTKLIALVLVLAVTAAPTCSKASLLSNAEDVLYSLNKARPLVDNLLPNASPKLAQALVIAEKLRAGVASSDANSAVGYLTDLIPVFSDIVERDVPQITDPAQRTQIMAALAIADIGLHFLVKNLIKRDGDTPPAARRAGARAGVLVEFDRKPQWGHLYKTEKR